jgi:hypothetical protein
MDRFIALIVSVLASLGVGARQQMLWQADLQIRSLTISEANGNLTARVVVSAEIGEALAARVEVLLPVGVGIVTLGSGCVAGPNVTGISALRARVECTLGNMPARTSREFFVVTTAPPTGVARGFAVVVMSDTPDPKPGNNFAERVIPNEE